MTSWRERICVLTTPGRLVVTTSTFQLLTTLYKNIRRICAHKKSVKFMFGRNPENNQREIVKMATDFWSRTEEKIIENLQEDALAVENRYDPPSVSYRFWLHFTGKGFMLHMIKSSEFLDHFRHGKRRWKKSWRWKLDHVAWAASAPVAPNVIYRRFMKSYWVDKCQNNSSFRFSGLL